MAVQRQTLSEPEILALVREAQEDQAECLCSPIWGYLNPGALGRQHRRFIRIMGKLSQGASWLKTTGAAIGVFVLFIVALTINSRFGWETDLFFSVMFGILLGIMLRVNTQYREAFTRVEVDEHRDYTGPDVVTAILRVWMPRLCFYGRSGVWRGDNEHNSIGNASSKVYLTTGKPSVEWLEDGGVRVTRTKRVTDFRRPDDLLDLPAERFAVTGSSTRARRAQLRRFGRHGWAMERFERPQKNFLERNFVWFLSGGFIAGAVLVVAFGLG